LESRADRRQGQTVPHRWLWIGYVVIKEVHRRFINSERTSTHTLRADQRVWGLARAGLSAGARSPAIRRIRGRGRPHCVVVHINHRFNSSLGAAWNGGAVGESRGPSSRADGASQMVGTAIGGRHTSATHNTKTDVGAPPQPKASTVSKVCIYVYIYISVCS